MYLIMVILTAKFANHSKVQLSKLKYKSQYKVQVINSTIIKSAVNIYYNLLNM